MTLDGYELPVVALLVGLATLANYVGWLGWDQQRNVGWNQQPGPYETWQIVGLVAVLVVIAAVAGWRGRASAGAASATVVMTLCFAIDAASEPAQYNDGLWPVGALLVAGGTFVGVKFVATCADGFAARREFSSRD